MQEKGLQEGENIPEGGNSPYSKVPSAWWQLWLSGSFMKVRGPSIHSPRPACPEVIRSDMNVPNLTPQGSVTTEAGEGTAWPCGHR